MKDQLESPKISSREEKAPEDISGATPPPADAPNIIAFNSRREVTGAEGTNRRPAKRGATMRQRRGTRPPRPAQPAHSARPAPSSHPTHNYGSLVDEGEDEGVLGRHRTKVVIAVMLLLGTGAWYFVHSSKGTTAPKAPERMVSIQLPPPPPPKIPPPPPPKVQPPPEQKMVQETAAEEKPKEEAPKPLEAPKEALGTGIKGDGPGLSGLGSSGNGGGFGGTKGGAGGSKWGWYAGQVQSRVAEALRRNGHTKSANMKIQVRIWADTTGRITRAKLDGSTGDPKLDAAIQNEVLTGLQLQEPPPPGMPSPIVLRLTARRP